MSIAPELEDEDLELTLKLEQLAKGAIAPAFVGIRPSVHIQMESEGERGVIRVRVGGGILASELSELFASIAGLFNDPETVKEIAVAEAEAMAEKANDE